MLVVRKATVPEGNLPPVRRPDFLARLLKIYGEKRMRVSGATLVKRDRNRD